MKSANNQDNIKTIIYQCEDIFCPCQEYYCGRVISFLSALISYLEDSNKDKSKIDAQIFTRGNKDNRSIDVSFSSNDKIENEYLLTKSSDKKVAIKINSISEILFKDKISINLPLKGILDKDAVFLLLADIEPPKDCIEIIESKELLLKSYIKSDNGLDQINSFNTIKLYNFTLKNQSIYSISEGIATFNMPDNGTVFAPFSSILEISGDFLF